MNPIMLGRIRRRPSSPAPASMARWTWIGRTPIIVVGAVTDANTPRPNRAPWLMSPVGPRTGFHSPVGPRQVLQLVQQGQFPGRKSAKVIPGDLGLSLEAAIRTKRGFAHA